MGSYAGRSGSRTRRRLEPRSSRRATAALREVASGNYFDPQVTRRIVVLLSDGESNPVDPSQVAGALARSHGYRFLAVRFWNPNERVYDSNGRAEPGYQPNPAGASIISGLAAATRRALVLRERRRRCRVRIFARLPVPARA